jgi:hypothetical protein
MHPVKRGRQNDMVGIWKPRECRNGIIKTEAIH